MKRVLKDLPLSPLHDKASFLWSLYSGCLSENITDRQTNRRGRGSRRRKKYEKDVGDKQSHTVHNPAVSERILSA